MVTDILATSGVHLGPGTLYGALARLEQQRLIAPLAARGRRRPYRITADGRRVLQAQLTTIEAVARVGLSRLRVAGDRA
jgi:DNA-binding PadR family transcriptional regulator